MKESRTIEGRWWLFGLDKPDCAGDLRFDPEAGLELEVKIPQRVGLLEMLTASPEILESPSIIHGRGADDEPITLFGCDGGISRLGSGIKKYNFYPLCAIVGQELPNSPPGNPPVTEKCGYALRCSTSGSAAIAFNRPPGLKTCYTSKFCPPRTSRPIFPTTSITDDLKTNSGADGFRINQDHHVTIEFPGPAKLDAIFVEYIQVLLRLLTLLIGTGVFIKQLALEIPDSGPPPDYAELLRRDSGIGAGERNRLISAMTLPHKECRANFPELICKWYEYHGRLKSALDLYFATLFNEDLYTSHQFLLLAQALEVYHNVNPRFVPVAQPLEAFRARRGRILESAPLEERG